MQNIYKHKAGSIDAQPTSVSSDTTSIVPALSLSNIKTLTMPTKINRSAKTGKFVTKKKAAKSPKTTVTETLYPYNLHKQATIDFIKSISVMGFNKVSVDTAKKGALLLIKKLKIK